MTKPFVVNNSGKTEWFTPPKIIRSARLVMGGIDLDPASCSKANEIVGADKYYTKEQDGLRQRWFGRVWLNPPYTAGVIDKFILKFCEHATRGDIEQACILVNNCTETRWFQQLASVCFDFCFTNGRLRYIDGDGNGLGSPLQGQCIVYYGNRRQEFTDEFEKHGIVLHRLTK